MVKLKNKICNHCKKELPITEFYKNKHCKDGGNSWCKSCQRESSKISQAKRRQDPIKRKKNYGNTLLAPNIIDEPSVQHHVNNNEIINVPLDIHTMYSTHPKEKHRFMVNQVAEQIYGELK